VRTKERERPTDALRVSTRRVLLTSEQPTLLVARPHRFIVSLQRESITYTYENVRTSYARARIGTVWRTMRGRQRRRSFFSTRGSSQVETSTSNIGIGIS
jgi:hypothetical protein